MVGSMDCRFWFDTSLVRSYRIEGGVRKVVVRNSTLLQLLVMIRARI